MCHACLLQVTYDMTTSVAEAVEEMANTIKLVNYQTFTLYEATRPMNFKVPAGDQQPEEHMLLDENRWVTLRGPPTARAHCALCVVG